MSLSFDFASFLRRACFGTGKRPTDSETSSHQRSVSGRTSSPRAKVEEITIFRSLSGRVVLFSAVLSTFLAGTAVGGTCNLDVPLQWTVNPTYVDGITFNAITGDGLGAYINGQSGVSATIKICTGTNDAVLGVGTRTFSFSFAKMLAWNSNTPSWAKDGSTVTGGGGLNIGNITFLPCAIRDANGICTARYTRADEYDFTTWADVGIPGTKNATWEFRMWNALSDADHWTDIYVSTVNTPYTDSLVNVHHCPANSTATAGPCYGISHETWFASANTAGSDYSTQTGLPLTQVGGLCNVQRPKTPVNGGQFSIPFSFVISTLQ